MTDNDDLHRAMELTIPVHPRLREIIEATPMVGVKTFLVTHFGKVYTAADEAAGRG